MSSPRMWFVGKSREGGCGGCRRRKTTRVAFRTGKMLPPAFNCDTAKKFHIPSTVFPILLFPPSRRIHSFVPDYQRRHCPLSRFLAQQESWALSALSVLLFRLYLTFCSFTFGGSGSGGTATDRDRQYTSCFLKQHVRPRSGLESIQIPAAARARFRINCSILFDRLVRKITALVMRNRRLAKPESDLNIDICE